MTAAGDIQILVTDTSTVTASVAATALAAGTFAIAAGLSVVINSINNQLAAYVSGSSVKSTGGGLTMSATATESTSATSIGIATALAIGAAAAGASATSTIGSTVAAYASNATLSSSGATQILASSSLTSSASTAAASVGAVGLGISALVPSVTIGGSTLAYVEGASTVNAANLAVDATSNNQANLPLGLSLAIGVVGGAARRQRDGHSDHRRVLGRGDGRCQHGHQRAAGERVDRSHVHIKRDQQCLGRCVRRNKHRCILEHRDN